MRWSETCVDQARVDRKGTAGSFALNLHAAVQYRLAKRAGICSYILHHLPSPAPTESRAGQPAGTASTSRGDRGDNVGGQFALAASGHVYFDIRNAGARRLARAVERRFDRLRRRPGPGRHLSGRRHGSGRRPTTAGPYGSPRRPAAASRKPCCSAKWTAWIRPCCALARAHDPFAADAPSASRRRGLARRPRPAPAAGRRGSALDGARELDCLTQAVYFEARGETPRGQAAVAQVVMNRVRNPSFPKTVCGVVFQGAADPRLPVQLRLRRLHAPRPRGRAPGTAPARSPPARCPACVLADVGSATHFHTTGVAPDWGPQMLRVAQVGLHVFYRFNPHAPRRAGARASARCS